MMLRELIERLLGFERRVRRVYLTLSERADFPAEVRVFWGEMAEDENQHRQYLERTAGLLNFVQTPPDIPEAILARVDAKIATVETMVQQADLNIDEALQQALFLEDDELRQLDDVWFEAFQPSVESFLHIKRPEEAQHLRRLCEAVDVFGTDEVLRAQAETLWSTYRQRVSGRAE